MKDDREIFKQLLLVSSLRGIHSTGVAVLANNKIELQKDAISPSAFLERDAKEKYAGIFDNFHTDMMMGHARWATVGDVTKENAHPFDTGKYVGAHNGTLVDYRFHQNKLTDSENLFKEMDKNGICETLKELLPSSAYALSIYDKVTGKLWLGRNKHRPLFIAQAKGMKVLYWASELEMLTLVLRRNGVDAEYKTLSPDIMFEIDIDAIDLVKKQPEPWITHNVPPKEFEVKIRPFNAEYVHEDYDPAKKRREEFLKNKKGDENTDVECSSCRKKLSLAEAINGYNWVSEGHKLCICEPCMNHDTGSKEVA